MTVGLSLSLGKDTQTNTAELWRPNSMPSPVLLYLNRVGAGPVHLEGTMLCDAEVHSTLADAEKHRNALVIPPGNLLLS